ncbi:MAG: PspA/IM30 family protein [Aeromicrobium sp.]|uniref:PspA/IM30 family protein n=1 Tax=Aeromicrobium sp. TaxID=1871063 RepID=UPI0039E4E4F5
MGLWDRMRRIARSRRDGDAEGWRDRIDETVRDQQATLAQLRRSLADLATNRRRVELQLGRLRQQTADLDAEAQRLVAAGNDDGARAALARKVTLDKAVADLAGRHESLLADEQRLTATADQVQTQIEDFRIRKDTLIARESAASAKSQMHHAQRDHGDVARELDEVDRRTREAEATASAYDELTDVTDSTAWDRAFGGPVVEEGDGRGPQSLPQ